jgi:hypothetical protein
MTARPGREILSRFRPFDADQTGGRENCQAKRELNHQPTSRRAAKLTVYAGASLDVVRNLRAERCAGSS